MAERLSMKSDSGELVKTNKERALCMKTQLFFSAQRCLGWKRPRENSAVGDFRV
jgi:hypothetical protein